MTDTPQAFFDRYAAALLARDEKAVAAMYAVPSLILFPGSPVVVTDRQQTEDFFASAWAQYEGVDALDKDVVILAEAPGSVWADVRWYHEGEQRERFCYQLVPGSSGLLIAVLTPMTAG